MEQLKNRPDWLVTAIAEGQPFHWRRQAPWRHNLINGAVVLASLVGMVLVLAWAGGQPFYIAVPVGGGVLAWLVLCLGSVVLHEAVHGMAFITRDVEATRRINAWLGRVAGVVLNTNYPVFWEIAHPLHHRTPFVPGDIQLPELMGGRVLVREMLKTLLIPGYVAVRNRHRTHRPGSLPFFANLAVWGLILTSLWSVWGWVAALTFVSGFVIMDAIVLVRQSQEHPLGVAGMSDLILSGRTVNSSLSWLIAPVGQNYHFEHHLNFSVPWYLLPSYHRRLEQVMPAALQPFFFQDTAAGLLRLASGTLPMPPDEMLRGDR